ncbi:unnamed protein product [Cercopithifilaria johnstoni]|uniref:Uncharacterized protein n=1 Tax=Cercopithifilaria johnstoni TaxID=2874296 RepID=A0A8J2M2Y1_9BILA|nr:unnamed protein product [Cercopithifilaria johnstoni]
MITEFALIPILLVYPVSACFGGLGCCQPQQHGCVGNPCGGGGYATPPKGGGYAVPQAGPSLSSYSVPQAGPSSYSVPQAGPSSYNVPQGGPGPSSYLAPPAAPPPPPSYFAPQAAPPPSYAAGPPPSYGGGGPSYSGGPPPSYSGGGPPPSYGGPQAGPGGGGPYNAPQPSYDGAPNAPPQSYSGSGALSASQAQYRDSTLGGAQPSLTPPENPPVPGRFAEAAEQATLPGDLGSISSLSSSTGETIDDATHEVTKQQEASKAQAVPIISKNNKLRHWQY